MELYHNAMSVCAQKVRLVVAHKGLRPVMHAMTLRNGDVYSPEYLRLNPKGVVPTLVDEGSVIVESTVICEYLEDRYPQPAMRPADAAGRARMRQWTLLCDAGLHTACGRVSVAVAWRHQMLAAAAADGGAAMARRPGDAADQAVFRRVIEQGVEADVMPAAVRLYAGAVRRMAGALAQGDWLAGADYSLADAAMLPYVLRLVHLGMGWVWEADGGAVDGWLARCGARANYAAITEYLEPSYVALAGEMGRAAEPRLRAMLAG